jgi:hypothetical protein
VAVQSKRDLPSILSGVSVIAVVTAAYWVGQVSWKLEQHITDVELHESQSEKRDFVEGVLESKLEVIEMKLQRIDAIEKKIDEIHRKLESLDRKQ